MSIIRTIKYFAIKLERFFVYKIMSLNDTPHRIALGVGIGIFVTWTPTIGIQMALTVALCTLFKANKFVGVPFVWISNPVTFIPIYYPNYWIGATLMGSDRDISAFDGITEAVIAQGSWIDKTSAWFSAIKPMFWELWVGSLIVSLVLGVIAYILIYKLTIIYRTKRNLLHLGTGKPRKSKKNKRKKEPSPEENK